MNFDELLELAKNDPILKKEIEQSETEDFTTFCHRMTNNEIKDYRPYIYGYNKQDHIHKMIQKSINLKEISELEEPEIIIDLIESGNATNLYEDLAKYGTATTRSILADYGLCPEILINDNDTDIICQTLMLHPEMLSIANNISKLETLKAIELYLEKSPNPDLETLNKILDYPQNKNYYKHLHQKHQAITIVPTAIEKTMTPYQLYQSKNILWAKNVPAKTIEFMTKAEQQLKHIDENTFNKICNCQTEFQFQRLINQQKGSPCSTLETSHSTTANASSFSQSKTITL